MGESYIDLRLDTPADVLYSSEQWKKKWENDLSESLQYRNQKRSVIVKNVLLYATLLLIALITFSTVSLKESSTIFPLSCSNGSIPSNQTIQSDELNTKINETYQYYDKLYKQSISSLNAVQSNVNAVSAKLNDVTLIRDNHSKASLDISSRMSILLTNQENLYYHIQSFQQELQTLTSSRDVMKDHTHQLASMDEKINEMLTISKRAQEGYDLAEKLQSQLFRYASRLNEALKHIEKLKSDYAQRLLVLEEENESLALACNMQDIESKIDSKLRELLSSQSSIGEETKPVKLNKIEADDGSSANVSWIDFASARLGGRIVNRMTSSTYFPVEEHSDTVKRLASLFPVDTATNIVHKVYDMLGVDIGVGKPEDAISEDMSLGSCWPLMGSNGILTVRLKSRIFVTSISIEHISRSVALDIRSAPNKFEVLGSETPEGGYLPLTNGSYSIEDGRGTSQTFDVIPDVTAKKFQYISLHIMSNHGHPNYTCLYRFRVHGRLDE